MKVEFHQAQVVVDVRLIDGEKSTGKRRFGFELLLNTDAEWDGARKQVAEGLKKIEAEVNADSD